MIHGHTNFGKQNAPRPLAYQHKILIIILSKANYDKHYPK